jgi:hypothetical protein
MGILKIFTVSELGRKWSNTRSSFIGMPGFDSVKISENSTPQTYLKHFHTMKSSQSFMKKPNSMHSR